MSRINVMDQDNFQERVQNVFARIANTLEKSFGPYGSNTFISRYPDLYTTKDGFNIMKSIEFDDHIDGIIKNMIFGICARLNDAVGDGTTTATVATSKIYEAYITEFRDQLANINASPRELLKKFQEVKEDVIHHLETVATPIDFEQDPENAAKMIRSVVSIASNNDSTLTDLISQAYQESNGAATIDVVEPESGTTNIKRIEGYHAKVVLMDGMYINNDNRTMKDSEANVIILDHKFDLNFYRMVLKPLAEKCRTMNRHLIVIAPFYDEVMMQNTIAYELKTEFRASKKPPVMVLTQCAFSTGFDRKRLADLAMLLGTEVIGSELAKQLRKEMEADMGNLSVIFSFNGEYRGEDNSDVVALGVSHKYELGANGSVFSGIDVDKDIYKVYVDEAKSDYTRICEKNRGLGTSTMESFEALKRYNALLMNAYRLEIGGQSKIVQRYNHDVADDAVQAAKSAVENGVILGCNIDTIRFLAEQIDRHGDPQNRSEELELFVYRMLYSGFIKVVDTILDNANLDDIIPSREYYDENSVFSLDRNKKITVGKEFFDKFGIETPDDVKDVGPLAFGCASNIIEEFCIQNRLVFDPVEKRFTKDIINSARTDIEILTAAIDLVSLLISGNQMVVLDQFAREQLNQ